MAQERSGSSCCGHRPHGRLSQRHAAHGPGRKQKRGSEYSPCSWRAALELLMHDTPKRSRGRPCKGDRPLSSSERNAARMRRLIEAEKLLKRYVELYGALPDIGDGS